MMAHYLRAVEAIRSDRDGAATVAEMKTMPANGFYSHGGHVRPDAQLSTNVYLGPGEDAKGIPLEMGCLQDRGDEPGQGAFSPQAKDRKLNAQ